MINLLGMLNVKAVFPTKLFESLKFFYDTIVTAWWKFPIFEIFPKKWYQFKDFIAICWISAEIGDFKHDAAASAWEMKEHSQTS